MRKDIDLQRQTQDILGLQREISRLETQVNDSSMNIQNSSISEHQLQRMMMQEAEAFSYPRSDTRKRTLEERSVVKSISPVRKSGKMPDS